MGAGACDTEAKRGEADDDAVGASEGEAGAGLGPNRSSISLTELFCGGGDWAVEEKVAEPEPNISASRSWLLGMMGVCTLTLAPAPLDISSPRRSAYSPLSDTIHSPQTHH